MSKIETVQEKLLGDNINVEGSIEFDELILHIGDYALWEEQGKIIINQFLEEEDQIVYSTKQPTRVKNWIKQNI